MSFEPPGLLVRVPNLNPLMIAQRAFHLSNFPLELPQNRSSLLTSNSPKRFSCLLLLFSSNRVELPNSLSQPGAAQPAAKSDDEIQCLQWTFSFPGIPDSSGSEPSFTIFRTLFCWYPVNE